MHGLNRWFRLSPGFRPERCFVDKLRAIQYFVAAVREGSLSAAARRLEVSVPAVAKLVAALERELGASLLDRSPRGLALTADGERYLAVCEGVLQQLAGIERQLGRQGAGPRGSVVVELPPLLARFWILPALPELHRQYPEVQIELRLIDRSTITDADAGGCDVCIVLGWPEALDRVVRQVARMRLLVCATPAYWARHGQPQRPRDLARHVACLVRNPKGVLLDYWRYRRSEEEEAVKLSGWLVSDHRDAVLDAVLAGEGIGRFADLSVQHLLHTGELVPVLLDWETPDDPPVNLLHRPLAQGPSALRVVVEFLDARIRQLEAGRGTPHADAEPDARPLWYRRAYGRASAVGGAATD